MSGNISIDGCVISLIEAEETLGVEDPRYAVTNSDVQDAKEVLDSAMQKACIDAYVMPTCLFEAWSRAGYPQVVVPLGFAPEDIAPVQLQDHPAHQTLDVWPGRYVVLISGRLGLLSCTNSGHSVSRLQAPPGAKPSSFHMHTGLSRPPITDFDGDRTMERCPRRRWSTETRYSMTGDSIREYELGQKNRLYCQLCIL